MAGSRGPVPSQSNQRRRRNKPDVVVDTAPSAMFGEVVVENAPKADDAWHPMAAEWFNSLARSGQAAFYEASDWAMARIAAQMMSKLCEADKPSAQMLASVLQLTSSLLATEGDRRRMRLELARGAQVDEDEQASVTAMADYQRKLQVGG
jgi:hypothetical protein